MQIFELQLLPPSDSEQRNHPPDVDRIDEVDFNCYSTYQKNSFDKQLVLSIGQGALILAVLSIDYN